MSEESSGSESSPSSSHSRWRALARYLKFLSSIQLAVMVIASIATLTAIGTIIEAKYDAQAAQKWVYKSPWMYGIMGLFALNLISVIVDRWPWKPKHSAFISAHIGILIILLGQYISGTYGLDGTLRVDIGQSSRLVTVQQTDINIYASFDGNNFSSLYNREVDFFLHPPQKEPLKFQLDEPIEFIQSENYVIPEKQVVESKQPQVGAAIRFEVHNPNADVVEWVTQRKEGITANYNLGPAAIYLGAIPKEGREKNEMFLEPDGEKLHYAVFNTHQKKAIKKGEIKEGDLVPTGWMNLEFRLLRYLPRAEEKWDITVKDRPTPMTTSAVKFRYKGTEQWLLLNDTVKLFSDKAVYFISYGNRRLDIGFPLKLKQFDIDRYQGTTRAAAYKSLVEVEGKESEISMNEPLKHNGLTIYQASFQEGPSGVPEASIFSVNYDPGRWLKYTGSLVMVLGIILMFYFRKRAKKPLPKV